MKASKAAYDLIKRFEELRLEAYLCPAGRWTIGWGHTAYAEPGQAISEAEAEQLLHDDVQPLESLISAAVTVPIEQHEFDALVSFCFNVGRGNFTKSTLLRRLNAGDHAGAAAEFARWTMAGARIVGQPPRTLPGLVARRAAELAMFQGAGETEVSDGASV